MEPYRSGMRYGAKVRPNGWHSVAASALGEALKKRTISRAKRSTAMPCSALRSFSCGLRVACADHTGTEPHRHDERSVGTTPIWDHARHNGPHSESRPAHDQAAHNGRTAQRAFVSHPAQRALSITGVRTTPAQRAPARRRGHNGRLGSAIRLSSMKNGCQPRAPDAERLALQRRAVASERTIGTKSVSKIATLSLSEARPLQAPVGRHGIISIRLTLIARSR